MFSNLDDTCMPGRNLNKKLPALVHVTWSAKNKGFGEFSFFFKKDDQGNEVLYCDNECENKAFIKRMLCQMVDDAVLVDKPFRNEDGTKNE